MIISSFTFKKLHARLEATSLFFFFHLSLKLLLRPQLLFFFKKKLPSQLAEPMWFLFPRHLPDGTEVLKSVHVVFLVSFFFCPNFFVHVFVFFLLSLLCVYLFFFHQCCHSCLQQLIMVVVYVYMSLCAFSLCEEPVLTCPSRSCFIIIVSFLFSPRPSRSSGSGSRSG